MYNDEIEEPYTKKEFGKDVAVSVAYGVAVTAAAYATIAVAGIAYSKVRELRARRAQKNLEQD